MMERSRTPNRGYKCSFNYVCRTHATQLLSHFTSCLPSLLQCCYPRVARGNLFQSRTCTPGGDVFASDMELIYLTIFHVGNAN